MTDFDVHISLDGVNHLVGRARSNRARGKEIVSFEYDEAWLRNENRFSLEPSLPLTRGGYQPPAGQSIHCSLGDSAPDSWGRRQAEREGRAVRTLMESDYLLGVADQKGPCEHELFKFHPLSFPYMRLKLL